jgi:hypothetical protein
MISRSEPVVCTLSSGQAGYRLAEWSDLRRAATSIEKLADGARFRLPATFVDDATELADRELQCCSFLDIEFTDLTGETEMTVTSTNPDGVPVVHLLAGLTDQ